MEVRVVYEKTDGGRAELGLMNLDHMPPIGEPFPMDGVAYTCKAFFGPDHHGKYLLVVEGEPQPIRH